MRVAVIGAGGAGGYFAARWVEAGKDVVLLARGHHLDRIRGEGLRLESPLGDATVSVEASDDPRVLEGSDVVIFATKTWQLPDALDAAAPHVSSTALVFGLQNGVQSVDLLGTAYPKDNVLGGTCRIISYIKEPGMIHHVGIPPTVIFGEPAGGISVRAREVASALDVQGTASVIASDEIAVELWKKFTFFAAVSGVGSVTRSPIGVFRRVPRTRTLLSDAVHEVAAVGRALGVDLPPDAAAAALSFIDQLPEDGTSSMQRDFESGRRTELEALSGYISRVGAEVDVPTPAHDFMYASLLPLASGPF